MPVPVIGPPLSLSLFRNKKPFASDIFIIRYSKSLITVTLAVAVAAVVAAAFVAAAAVAESCQLPHKYAYYPYRVFVSLGHTNAVAKALWEDMLLLS